MNDFLILVIVFGFLVVSFLVGMTLVIFARPILAWFMSPKRIWRRGPKYCYDEGKGLYYVEASPSAILLQSKLGYTCDPEKGRIYITPARIQVIMIRVTGVLLAASSLLVLLILVYVALTTSHI